MNTTTTSTPNHFDREELTRRAAEYRKADSRLKGGVIVFRQGEIQGWVNALRDPHHWQPECVAIDEQGNLFIALGGNDRDGARRWGKLTLPFTHYGWEARAIALYSRPSKPSISAIARWLREEGFESALYHRVRSYLMSLPAELHIKKSNPTRVGPKH